ncbi:CD209 antigen-like isoform X3 [Dicentrarchus labrax]|uniref:CD209 antigen-like isoform X3 n=1 Tax=Dicentrarchus labrax TaxID=13489 RepID=UPI0021F500EA|nr:CD209 antigen-like isoform X3 [Dicentrarchus labrax]
MAVSFHSSESDISVALGEYQEFPRPEPEDAAAERAPKLSETEEESCPQDWLTFGSSCYYISWQGKSWDDSRQDCLQRDADLVIINSIQEQAFLTGFTEAAWVGMTDRKKEGTWVWVDGAPVNKDDVICSVLLDASGWCLLSNIAAYSPEFRAFPRTSTFRSGDCGGARMHCGRVWWNLGVWPQNATQPTLAFTKGLI